MAISATNTVSQTSGLAEDFEDIINDISPTDTPLYTMAKKKKAMGRYHEWQTDALEAAAANAQAEGDDAAFATLAPTTTLGNYCQISRKTAQVSGTLESVKKYGRRSQMAYELMKAGKSLKRDIEYAIVRNQASASATARATGGLECWIASSAGGGNGVAANAAQTTDYSVRGFSAASVTAPEDGSSVTFVEADLKTALGLAWADGGEPSVLMMSSTNKARFDTFAGIATKYSEVKGTSQATITGASDIYVSSYGNHMVKLNRHMRDNVVFGIDPEYVSVAFLRPIQKKELADTGDSSKQMILAEYALVVDNPSAHCAVGGVGL